MTLQEQWDDLQTIVERRAKSIMDAAYPSFPGEFYRVYQTGKMEVCLVKKATYVFPFSTYPSGKKPTAKDVTRLGEDLSKPPVIDPLKMYFDYTTTGSGAHSSSVKARDLFEETNGLFISKEKAESESIRLFEKWKSDRDFDELHKKDVGYDYNKNGYKFLGWQNSWNHVYFDADGNVTTDPAKKKSFGYLTCDYPEYGKCREEKHRLVEVHHNQRGSENTVSCPVCKIYYKYDSSD